MAVLIVWGSPGSITTIMAHCNMGANSGHLESQDMREFTRSLCKCMSHASVNAES